MKNNYSIISIVLFTIFILQISCDPHYKPKDEAEPVVISEPRYNIQGFVSDSNTGESLSEVQIILGIHTDDGTNFRSKPFISTDQNGYYCHVMVGSHPTEELFRFIKPGYIPLELLVSKQAVKLERFSYTLNVELEAVSTRQRYD